MQYNYHTESTCILSSLVWKTISPTTQITNFHSQQGSATKITFISTRTWKRMWSSMHKPVVDNKASQKWLIATLLSARVCGVMCLLAFCMHVSTVSTSHGFHSSDSSATNIRLTPLHFPSSNSELKECWWPVGFCFLISNSKIAEVMVQQSLSYASLPSQMCGSSSLMYSPGRTR